jgi:hypothetical protein
MENTKENIKKIFKETKECTKNDFIMGVEKYFKKNKMLSDKQFDCLINWHKDKTNKDEKDIKKNT